MMIFSDPTQCGRLIRYLRPAYLSRKPSLHNPYLFPSRHKVTHQDHGPGAHHKSDWSQHRIRNVGVIAHIDAGKTTTTERMLFLAGRTRILGEVDRGNTVTDYLTEERERGISIMSATACFSWRRHDIHLIDTPGHVDFTLEVERSMAVVDSAVAIIDACKGVETQTRTVWAQADRCDLPRIVFINKMDRPRADFTGCLNSLRSRFGKQRTFIPLQSPVFSAPTNSGNFIGLIDLTNLTLKIWSIGNNESGTVFSNLNLLDKFDATSVSQTQSLPETLRTHLAEKLVSITHSAFQEREKLLSALAELDEEFAEEFLLLDKPEHLLSPDVVHSCVRRVTLSTRAIPVLLGSSKNNIGIQPVMDAIVDFLPDPTYRPPPPIVVRCMDRFVSTSAQRSGAQHDLNSIPLLFVFKVLFDAHWGALSLARIYSGSVTPGMSIENWTRCDDSVCLAEKVGRVFQLNGDSYDALDTASPGYIVALSGLQSTRAGDILGPVMRSSKRSKENVAGETGDHALSDFLQDDSDELSIPHPIVHAALEPHSSASIRNLERALLCLQREDPSFTASFSSETGQWVVGGMGDLHLEVILSRLRREYKVDVSMGNLLTSYKEIPMPSGSDFANSATGSGTATGLVEHRKRSFLTKLLVHVSGHLLASEKPRILFDKDWSIHTSTNTSLSGSISDSGAWKKARNNVKQACELALSAGGPLLRSRVVGTIIHIQLVGELNDSSLDEVASCLRIPTSSQSMIAYFALLRSALVKAVKEALSKLPDWRIMEPFMAVEINLPLDDSSTNESSVSAFIGEICRRRGEIECTDVLEHLGASECCVRAFIPLAELHGFSAAVRSLSSGQAEINLRLADYRPVSLSHQEQLIGRFHTQPTFLNRKHPIEDDE